MNLSKLSDDQKAAYVVGLFRKGHTAKEIVKLTKLPAPKVLEYRKIHEENVEAQDIADIIQHEESDQAKHAAITEHVINELAITEEAKNVLLEELEEATIEVKGLKVLNLSLQSSAIQLINTVSDRCTSNSIKPSELNTLATIICKIQESFFNPNQTNVNIINPNGSTEGSSPFSKYMRD